MVEAWQHIDRCVSLKYPDPVAQRKGYEDLYHEIIWTRHLSNRNHRTRSADAAAWRKCAALTTELASKVRDGIADRPLIDFFSSERIALTFGPAAPCLDMSARPGWLTVSELLDAVAEELTRHARSSMKAPRLVERVRTGTAIRTGTRIFIASLLRYFHETFEQGLPHCVAAITNVVLKENIGTDQVKQVWRLERARAKRDAIKRQLRAGRNPVR